MKLANLHLVTGYAGYEHVTAADQGAFNVAMLGSGQFVINKGNKLAASVVTNNKIRISDGDIYMQGRFIRLNEGTYVDLAIDSGAQGKKRNDLIVARYTKDATSGVEQVNLVVIKGTAVASTSTPADPAYNSGNITEGKNNLNDMPLYSVPIDGLNVQTLVPLFTVKSLLIPQTAEDIGARPNTWVPTATDVGAMKAYTSLEQIGVTKGSETISGIVSKMSNNSMLLLNVNTESDGYNPAAYPAAWGLLTIKKAANTRIEIEFMDVKSNPSRFYKKSYRSGTESEWAEVYTSIRKPTAEDVGAAKIEYGSYTGTGMSGVNHPTEVTLDFVPKMVWIWRRGYSPVGHDDYGYTFPCEGLTNSYNDVHTEACMGNYVIERKKAKLDGTKFSFYCVGGGEKTDEDDGSKYFACTFEQLNHNGIVYDYMAIG